MTIAAEPLINTEPFSTPNATAVGAYIVIDCEAESQVASQSCFSFCFGFSLWIRRIRSFGTKLNRILALIGTLIV